MDKYYKQLETIYGDMYGDNLDKWSFEPQMRVMQNYLLEELTKSKTDFNNISLLDIGCGKGYDVHFFAAKGVNTTGIDICSFDSWKSSGYNKATFVKSSIFDFFPEKKFDAISDNGCFHHFIPKDYSVFFRKIDSLMNDDGIFCVSVFYSEKPNLEVDGRGRYWKVFNTEELTNLVNAHGFGILSTKVVKRNQKATDYLIAFLKKNITK